LQKQREKQGRGAEQSEKGLDDDRNIGNEMRGKKILRKCVEAKEKRCDNICNLIGKLAENGEVPSTA